MSYNRTIPPVPQYTNLSFLSGQTPAQVFQRISDCPDAFWLDSGNSSSQCWTYQGAFANEALFDYDFVTKQLFPANSIVANRISIPTEKNNLRVNSFIVTGWVGHINYEQHATTLSQNAPRLHSAVFKHYNTLLAFSHADRSWTLITTRGATPDEIQDRWLVSEERTAQPGLPVHSNALSNLSRAKFETNVRKVLNYISEGDIYQANISQKFSAPWEGTPEELYLRLRAESPAEFGAYLSPSFLDSPAAICSISPELFMSVQDGIIETRPIKGTRPRPSSNLEAVVSELNSNPKEIAELNMIIDLERNDLGRVCEYGSVEVASNGHVEVLPTLLHRVGIVRGKLRHNATLQEIFAAVFPGGSVTGAPKIRAMEIIRELEPEPRGPYCGAIGWIGDDGSMKFNLAIRTAVFDAERRVAHYHAGSGIVADSDPAAEYDETLQKAAAFFRATNSTPGVD